MSYTTSYSGPQIDEALGRAKYLLTQANGWIKLPSTPEEKYDLTNARSPGNYTLDYWENGPEIGLMTPLNLSVYRIDGKLYQSVPYFSDVYYRQYDEEGKQWGDWVCEQPATKADIGGDTPSQPADHTLWFDVKEEEVKDPDNPSEQTKEKHVYPKIWVETTDPDTGETSGAWVDLAPQDMMTSDVYDPNHQGGDVFDFIEQKTKELQAAEVQTEIESHIQDSEKHVTEEQMTKWDEMPSAEEVLDDIAELTAEVEGQAITEAEKMSNKSSQIETEIYQYEQNLKRHVNDYTIHPSLTKQAQWDAKANPDHTHNHDGSVKISAEDVVDGIIDPKLINQAAKESLVKLDKLDDVYKLTTEQAQNGDMIYIKDPRQVYYVVDETKFCTKEEVEKWGTDESSEKPTDEQKKQIMSGLKLFSASSVVLGWEEIEDKPTTLEGFGITDAYTKEEVDEKVGPIEDLFEQYADTIVSVESFAGKDETELVAQVQDTSQKIDAFAKEHAELKANIESILGLVQQLEAMII